MTSDPQDLFEVEDETAADLASSAPQDGLVLLHALRGFIDAGGRARSPPSTCSSVSTGAAWRRSTPISSWTTARAGPR